MSNNIILIIFILLLVGIFIYFYYTNGKENEPLDENKELIPSKNNYARNRSKKVRFNNNIKYNTYSKNSSDASASSSNQNARLRSPTISRKLKIDVDSILRSDDRSSPEIDLDGIILRKNKVMPSNLDIKDPEETWYSSFGLPLMSKAEKQDFCEKMKENHKNYEKSLGEFTKYQTDSSTIIKTDITIDPFKPEKRNNKLKGKAIKDIYDKQVAGPKAKPKRIKHRTATSTIYEDESELNGGTISGTNLHGFDGVNDGFKQASFGNEF